MTGLFHQFPRNLVRCFQWKCFVWHLAAMASTYVLVMSGFDWSYYSYFRNTAVYRAMFPAAPLGGLVPIFLPIALLVMGAAASNFRLKNTGFAIAQAAISGLLVSSFYKAFTGRAHPMRRALVVVDNSREFHFGFMRGGVFWGWPSSHTAVAFSCAAAVFMLYPRSRAVRVCAAVLALYIGLGVSMSIHWFSDFVAGAMIGTTIGIVVGRSFREREAGKLGIEAESVPSS